MDRGMGPQIWKSRSREAGAEFAMLLDDAGRSCGSIACGAAGPPVYLAEIASFTRWDLDDYPVSVMGGERGFGPGVSQGKRLGTTDPPGLLGMLRYLWHSCWIF
jgi:hypothetical protein